MKPDAMILIEQKVGCGLELIITEKDFLNVRTVKNTGSKTNNI